MIWPDTLDVTCSLTCCLQTGRINVTGHRTLNCTESRNEPVLNVQKSEEVSGHHGISCNTFLGQLLFYPEGFVVWSLSRGLHKHILFPCTLLESLGWCWSQCHADLLFSFAGMFSVWILYCFWHPGIWLGNPLDFCSVYLLSCQSYGVAQCRCEPLDSCVNSTTVFHKGRQTFISLTRLKATEILSLPMWHSLRRVVTRERRASDIEKYFSKRERSRKELPSLHLFENEIEAFGLCIIMKYAVTTAKLHVFNRTPKIIQPRWIYSFLDWFCGSVVNICHF